jgi:hypothetical protein
VWFAVAGAGVSGLRSTYDPSQPAGSRVNSITVSATGQPTDPGANYRVVTNDISRSTAATTT